MDLILDRDLLVRREVAEGRDDLDSRARQGALCLSDECLVKLMGSELSMHNVRIGHLHEGEASHRRSLPSPCMPRERQSAGRRYPRPTRTSRWSAIWPAGSRSAMYSGGQVHTRTMLTSTSNPAFL